MFIRAKNLLLAKTTAGRSPIYPGETVEVEDAVGREFVELKAAVEVTPAEAERAGKAPLGDNPNGNTPNMQKAAEEPKTGVPVDDENNTMDRAHLETLSFTELKEIAKEYGVYSGTMRSKESVIEALTAVQVSDEELPAFDAQDVVEE